MAFLDTRAGIAVLTNVPKKKYPYPMTTSQEMGWDTELMAIHRPKYAFNRKMEAETKYVSNYFQAMGVSPLIQKKPPPAPGK